MASRRPLLHWQYFRLDVRVRGWKRRSVSRGRSKRRHDGEREWPLLISQGCVFARLVGVVQAEGYLQTHAAKACHREQQHDGARRTRPQDGYDDESIHGEFARDSQCTTHSDPQPRVYSNGRDDSSCFRTSCA
jgi:hypothetical protein